METMVRIIDLCGREPEQTVPLSCLDLPSDAIDHILDMWAEGRTAYIGEIEYQDAAGT